MRLYEIAAQDSAIKLANEALDARAEALAPERMERIQKRRQGENKVGENEGKEKNLSIGSQLAQSMNDVADASIGGINNTDQRRSLRLRGVRKGGEGGGNGMEKESRKEKVNKKVMKREEKKGIEKGKLKKKDTKREDIEKGEYKEQRGDTEKREDEEEETKESETKNTHGKHHDTFQRSHKKFVITFKPRKNICARRSSIHMGDLSTNIQTESQDDFLPAKSINNRQSKSAGPRLENEKTGRWTGLEDDLIARFGQIHSSFSARNSAKRNKSISMIPIHQTFSDATIDLSSRFFHTLGQVGRPIWDGVSVIFRVLITHFLKPLAMLGTFLLIIAVVHRGICSVSLAAYAIQSCNAPTHSSSSVRPFTGTFEDSEIYKNINPMIQNTKHMNQWRFTGKFEDLGLALLHTGSAMRDLSQILQLSPSSIPSQSKVIDAALVYVDQTEDLSDELAVISSRIQLMYTLTSSQLRDIAEKMSRSQDRSRESTWRLWLDAPSIVFTVSPFSGYSTLLRGARQAREEQKRIDMMKDFCDFLGSWLNQLEKEIVNVQKGFKKINDIQSFISGSISRDEKVVSKSQSLLIAEKNQPLNRITELLVGTNEKRRLSLWEHVNQRELLDISKSTIKDMSDKLEQIIHVIGKSKANVRLGKNVLGAYERDVRDGNMRENEMFIAIDASMKQLSEQPKPGPGPTARKTKKFVILD